MTETTEKPNCEISSEMVGENADHEKVLHFHAAHGRPHTLSIFFNGLLDQYVSIDDAALDAMIQKRDEMRALTEENADVHKADTRHEVGSITLVHTSDNDFVIKHNSDVILVSIDEARQIAALIDEA